MIHGAGPRPVSEPSDRLPARIAAALVPQPAHIATLDGQTVTAGTIEFSGTPAAWSATLRNLDRPGQIATRFFAEGLRDVIVVLQDGRRGRARITGTTFLASAQRVCTLNGVERIL
jgi:hypothetical protein